MIPGSMKMSMKTTKSMKMKITANSMNHAVPVFFAARSRVVNGWRKNSLIRWGGKQMLRCSPVRGGRRQTRLPTLHAVWLHHGKQHESRRARILRGALARRKRLAEKFINPMGRQTDAALFSGPRRAAADETTYTARGVAADPDDVLFSGNRSTQPEY